MDIGMLWPRAVVRNLQQILFNTIVCKDQLTSLWGCGALAEGGMLKTSAEI